MTKNEKFTGNRFQLTGRINWIEITYLESGNAMTKVILSKKAKNDEYQSFYITFFDNKNEPTAQKLADNCTTGDYINAIGELDLNTFKNKSTNKDISNIALKSWSFTKVEWNAEKKSYVEAA